MTAETQAPDPSQNWEGAEEWMPLAWELCANECGEEACTELIWEGGPIPEPWGDRWLKYEDQAKEMIAMVRASLAAVQAPESALRAAAQRVLDDCIRISNSLDGSERHNGALAALRAALAIPAPEGALTDEQIDALVTNDEKGYASEFNSVTSVVTLNAHHRAIRAALAAPAPQAAPVAQWHPIETAPKDGRKLLLSYVNRCGKTRTVLACWLTDEEAAETDADGVGLEGGWYECIDNWEDYTEVAIHQGEPTHWMPLPAAPQTKETKA